MTCLAIDQYQPGIFYLQNIKILNDFFLGLKSKSQIYFVFVIRNIDSNAKMGNEQLDILHQL